MDSYYINDLKKKIKMNLEIIQKMTKKKIKKEKIKIKIKVIYNDL